MSNEEIDRLKEAYFSGKSSGEEEQWLKKNANDPFFNTLKEEREQKTDWNFDDFLTTVEKEEPAKIGIFSYRKMVYRAAAAVALIVFGILFFVQNTNIEQPKYTKHEDAPATKIKPKEKVNNTLPEEIIEEKIQLPEKRTVKPVSKQKAIIPEEDTYNPEYVVINGKPIYDPEEAKELTMNSLNLLASNMEKGVSGMENIKYLSVKF